MAESLEGIGSSVSVEAIISELNAPDGANSETIMSENISATTVETSSSPQNEANEAPTTHETTNAQDAKAPNSNSVADTKVLVESLQGFINALTAGNISPQEKMFIYSGLQSIITIISKNRIYGSAYIKVGLILQILYPNGIRPDQYKDMQILVRVMDKMLRITNNDHTEDPYLDIAGYGLLGHTAYGK